MSKKAHFKNSLCSFIRGQCLDKQFMMTRFTLYNIFWPFTDHTRLGYLMFNLILAPMNSSHKRHLKIF